MPAAANVQKRLVAKPRVDESFAFAGSGYLGWSQNSPHNPEFYNLYLRSPDGKTTRLNPAGTNAFGGGIDGNTLVYQRITDEIEDIWSVDLTTMVQTPLIATVTSDPEIQPTISGDWILFGRTPAPFSQVLLYNRSTGEIRKLAALRGNPITYVYPGQVSGNYAVWGKITRRSQTVFLYDIAANRSTPIAKEPGRYDYYPAVTANGTVYFVRSKFGCGKSVALYRQPLGGRARAFERLPRRVDVDFTLYAAPANGQTELLYSPTPCGTFLGDVYSLTVTG